MKRDPKQEKRFLAPATGLPPSATPVPITHGDPLAWARKQQADAEALTGWAVPALDDLPVRPVELFPEVEHAEPVHPEAPVAPEEAPALPEAPEVKAVPADAVERDQGDVKRDQGDADLAAFDLDTDPALDAEAGRVFCGEADPLDGYNPSQRIEAELTGTRRWSLAIPTSSSYAYLRYDRGTASIEVDAARCSTPARFLDTLTGLVAEHATGNLDACALGEGVYLLTMLTAPDLVKGERPKRDKIVQRIRKRVPVADRKERVRDALDRWAASVAAGKLPPKRRPRRSKYA